jgi:hypothetical protein
VLAHQHKEPVVTATWVKISKIRKKDFDVLTSRSRSAIDIWGLFKSVAVELEMEKVTLGHFSLSASFYLTTSALFHQFYPLTCVHLSLVLHKVSSWQCEDIYIYISKSKYSTLLAAHMIFLMYKKFLSVSANFHSLFP